MIVKYSRKLLEPLSTEHLLKYWMSGCHLIDEPCIYDSCKKCENVDICSSNKTFNIKIVKDIISGRK